MAQIFSSPFGTGLNGLSTIASNLAFSSITSAITGCSGSSGSTTLTVTSTTGFVTGQRIIIQKCQGTTTTDSGAWEINFVVSVGASTLTLAFPLANTYQDGSTEQSQVMTWFETSNMNINSGSTLSLDAFNNDTGGLALISARGRLTVSGTISGAGKGYNGGGGSGSPGGQGSQGRSETGTQVGAMAANGSGGGGGKGGGGAGAGGTAYMTDSSLVTRLVFGGGGGGGNSNAGAGGSGGAGGGIIIIFAKELYVASGGVISVNGADGAGGASNQGGGGSGGGGIIYIRAERVVNNGTISASTGAAGAGSAGGDGGGGGAGGTNGNTSGGPGGTGGVGSDGRIRIEAGSIVNNGTITPTHTTTTSLLPWAGRAGLIG